MFKDWNKKRICTKLAILIGSKVTCPLGTETMLLETLQDFHSPLFFESQCLYWVQWTYTSHYVSHERLIARLQHFLFSSLHINTMLLIHATHKGR